MTYELVEAEGGSMPAIIHSETRRSILGIDERVVGVDQVSTPVFADRTIANRVLVMLNESQDVPKLGRVLPELAAEELVAKKAKRKAAKVKRKARKERKAADAARKWAAALKDDCPVCSATSGVYCFVRSGYFLDVHERRRKKAEL